MHACTNHKSCIEEAISKADLICKDKGLRFTELRRRILEIIWAGHGPAKAYEILDELKGCSASAKPPTVYRTLDFLLESGLIHRLTSLSAYVGCSHPLRHNNCYFLICKDCGEIKECCSSELTNTILDNADKSKFASGQITLEIEGKCRDCGMKSPNK